MSDVALRVVGLGKRYRLAGQSGSRRYRTLRDDVAALPQRAWSALWRRGATKAAFWALQDVSFELHQGEVLGIIGRNGAGKSTLLKILARITEPTTGQAEVYGRVGSLLEVGTGFHPELTGRENIYLSGAVLGMERREVRRKFDEIVDFAEVERFLDTPAKHYSSGMYMRLAFAVAAHLEPEILLVDEVLAVGDAEFQQKCLGKMSAVAQAGRTVLFVSHNMVAVSALCHTGLVLSGGLVAFRGKAQAAIDFYDSARQSVPREIELRLRSDRSGSGRLRFTSVSFRTAGGEQTPAVRCGAPLVVAVSYEADSSEALRNVTISIPFYGAGGQAVFNCWTRLTGQDFDTLPPAGVILLEIPRVPLRAGAYTINLWCEVNGVQADWIQEAAQIEVLEGDYYGTGVVAPNSYGPFLVDHHFEYEPLTTTGAVLQAKAGA
jgi:lipopolysaccharide transport system ATP-binding protein